MTQHTYGWEANEPVHHNHKSSHTWRRFAERAWRVRGELFVSDKDEIERWTEIAECCDPIWRNEDESN